MATIWKSPGRTNMTILWQKIGIEKMDERSPHDACVVESPYAYSALVEMKITAG